MCAGRDHRVGIVHRDAVVVLIVARTLHGAVALRIVLVGTQRVAAGCQGDTGDETLSELLRAALHADAGCRGHVDSSLLQVGYQGLLNLLAVGHGDGLNATDGCGYEGEGHIAEHHHEVVIDHRTHTLGLADPLQHLLVDDAVAFGIKLVVTISILNVIDGRLLGVGDKLIAIFNQVVSRRPELEDVATLVVAVETAIGGMRVAAAVADGDIYIAVEYECALVGIAVEVADKCLGIDTIEGALYLRLHAVDEVDSAL